MFNLIFFFRILYPEVVSKLNELWNNEYKVIGSCFVNTELRHEVIVSVVPLLINLIWFGSHTQNSISLNKCPWHIFEVVYLISSSSTFWLKVLDAILFFLMVNNIGCFHDTDSVILLQVYNYNISFSLSCLNFSCNPCKV